MDGTVFNDRYWWSNCEQCIDKINFKMEAFNATRFKQTQQFRFGNKYLPTVAFGTALLLPNIHTLVTIAAATKPKMHMIMKEQWFMFFTRAAVCDGTIYGTRHMSCLSLVLCGRCYCCRLLFCFVLLDFDTRRKMQPTVHKKGISVVADIFYGQTE
jgi:hypothetical protein